MSGFVREFLLMSVFTGSSFQNTDLEFQLRQRDISKVAVAGLEANTCFEATSRYAFEL